MSPPDNYGEAPRRNLDQSIDPIAITVENTSAEVGHRTKPSHLLPEKCGPESASGNVAKANAQFALTTEWGNRSQPARVSIEADFRRSFSD
jgi:hypothetical protein